MINNQDRAALRGLGERLAAQADYTQHPVFGYVPARVDLDGREWGSVAEAFVHRNKTTINFLTHSLVKPPEGVTREDYIQVRIAQDTGFHSFSFLGQGTGTTVLLGKSDTDLAVLRVSPHIGLIEKGFIPTYKDDCARSQFPGLLQPKQAAVDIDQTLQVEVLPLGQVVSLTGEEKELVGRYLRHITEDTCFDPQLHEAMVLPDGTFVGFDPGELRYRPEFWDLTPEQRLYEELRSVELVSERLQSWGVPGAFNWLDKQGCLKQDLYFGYTGDANSTPDTLPHTEYEGEQPSIG